LNPHARFDFLLRLGLVASAFALPTSCFSERSTPSAPLQPTLVAVDPEDFLGDVACLEAPGAMRRYVATIVDVTPASADAEAIGEFMLPSTVPVSCLQRAGSALVVLDRTYAAEVDGYDRIDIVPLAPGSRTMVDAATGQYVRPRWTTSCGRDPGEAVTARPRVTRLVRGCDPLSDAAPTDITAVSVGVDPTVVGLSCGSDAGQLGRVTVENLHTGETLTADCGGRVEFHDLEAGRLYQFEVFAYESGRSTPSYAADCHATAVHGTIVPASCDPLAKAPDAGAGPDAGAEDASAG
jgi:hypothetical protein